MNIFEFVQFILNELVGYAVIVEVPELFDIYSNITNWTQIFNPVIICSTIVYVGIFLFVWQMCFILPYRFIKRLIRFPSRKGSEF